MFKKNLKLLPWKGFGTSSTVRLCEEADSKEIQV